MRWILLLWMVGCGGPDADGDGYTVADGDCDDAEASLNLDDLDGDGTTTCMGDCDDSDASLGPRAADGDCDGVFTEEDCDDADPAAPSEDADCDGVPTDRDCDDADPSMPATDADCDGVPTEEDCDDADPAAPSRDSDCDGTEDPWDKVEGPEHRAYGFAFADPVGTEWGGESGYLGTVAWDAHAALVADLDLDAGGSSRRFLMRTYPERPYNCGAGWQGSSSGADWTEPPPDCAFHWITEVEGTTVNWRVRDPAILELPLEVFAGHVGQMLERLEAEDDRYLANLSPEQLAVAESAEQIYAIDAEVTMWDRLFFGDMQSANFELSYVAETGQAWVHSRSGSSTNDYLYFDKTGPDDAPVFTPTRQWQILAEAHIAHVEYVKARLGHGGVSMYGGPWSVEWRDPGRAVYDTGLPIERLPDVVADAMTRVAAIPLETGTMRRFIDAVGLNGGAWYAYTHDRWSGWTRTWDGVLFDAVTYGLEQASLEHSTMDHKGAVWLWVASTSRDARFVSATELEELWPGTGGDGGYRFGDEALFGPTPAGEEMSGIAGQYPLTPGIVASMAQTLQDRNLVGYAFVPTGLLRTHRLDPERLSDAAREAAEIQTIHSLGALDWADDAWDPPADLALGDDATHAYIVELLYEHVLGPLRR